MNPERCGKFIEVSVGPAADLDCGLLSGHAGSCLPYEGCGSPGWQNQLGNDLWPDSPTGDDDK